jgi:hypothetical protein
VSGLTVVQLDLPEANAYVERHHRHSVPTVGHKFSLGAVADGEVVGVAIVGRPVARMLQDGWTLEALRVCTTGHRNACSFLYGASWKATRALGFLRIITYTTTAEHAASVRAAGWVKESVREAALDWSVPSRPRNSGHTPTGVVRWVNRAASWSPELGPRPRVSLGGDVEQLELAA